ncbi:hypothetical protein, partial [Alcanivorax quisquiliarum]
QREVGAMAGFVERSREEGRQEGRQEGWQEGRQEGWQEGRQEGRQEGWKESCLVIASRLIRNTSMDDAGIAEITELPEAEIRALRQKTAR